MVVAGFSSFSVRANPVDSVTDDNKDAVLKTLQDSAAAFERKDI